jgi:hypothetical protein
MKTQQEACSAEGQLCRSLKSDPNRFAALSSRRHAAVTALSTAVVAWDAIFRAQGPCHRADAADAAAVAVPGAGSACARFGKDPANATAFGKLFATPDAAQNAASAVH